MRRAEKWFTNRMLGRCLGLWHHESTYRHLLSVRAHRFEVSRNYRDKRSAFGAWAAGVAASHSKQHAIAHAHRRMGAMRMRQMLQAWFAHAQWRRSAAAACAGMPQTQIANKQWCSSQLISMTANYRWGNDD